MRKTIAFIFGLLLLTSLACSFNFSTAKISEAKMARDAAGNEPTTAFAQNEAFYCVVELANAPADTTVKAAWMAVDVGDLAPNLLIGESELTGAETLTFDLPNDKLWPTGQYKVDLYLNGELDRTLEFQVKEPAVAQAPTPTPELQPESPATPELPTPTVTLEPELEPTATPEPIIMAGSSTGDSSAGDPLDIELVSERGKIEALPFKDELYVHTSGAFGFAVPEGWEVLNEDETSVTVTDMDSLLGALFADAGEVYEEQEMADYIDGFLTMFMGYLAEDYEVLEQKILDDGSTLVAVEYTASGRKNDADFIFQQQDTIIFVLLFTSSRYEELAPTWNKIIESYTIDLEAAKIAAQPLAPAETPTSEPTVAPVAPTPTPAPNKSGYAPQPGRARVYVANDYNETLTFTINNTENKVSTGSEVPIDLNPGKYTYTISIPGGAVNGEVEVGPDQSWAVYVDEHGSVYEPFQVYP